MTPKKPRKNGPLARASSDRAKASTAQRGAVDSDSPVYRSEGQRLLCAVRASLGEIAGAVGASSRQSVAWWKDGTKLPGPAFRAKLLEHYKIPVDAWTIAALTPPSPRSSRDASPAGGSDGTGKPVETPEAVDDMIRSLRIELEKPGLIPDERVRLTSSLTRCLALKHKIEGDREALEDRIVREHPLWHRIKRAISKALAPHPDAARAVLDALADLELDT